MLEPKSSGGLKQQQQQQLAPRANPTVLARLEQPSQFPWLSPFSPCLLSLPGSPQLSPAKFDSLSLELFGKVQTGTYLCGCLKGSTKCCWKVNFGRDRRLGKQRELPCIQAENGLQGESTVKRYPGGGEGLLGVIGR